MAFCGILEERLVTSVTSRSPVQLPPNIRLQLHHNQRPNPVLRLRRKAASPLQRGHAVVLRGRACGHCPLQYPLSRLRRKTASPLQRGRSLMQCRGVWCWSGVVVVTGFRCSPPQRSHVCLGIGRGTM